MKDLNWIKHAKIAHRGLYTKDQSVPENSMLAFQKALEKGYAIELDVNMTKDDVVIAFHDYQLKRVFNNHRNIDELTYTELKEMNLFQTHEKVPTLTDVICYVHGKVPLLIELKPHVNVKKLCHETMRVLENYPGSYALFSFHPKVVYTLKKVYPWVIRGQISEYFKDDLNMSKLSKYLMKSMFFNRFTKPDFISYGINDLPNKYLDKYKKKGLTIISYAAQSQEAYDRVKSFYDNVVFEYFEPN
jgi:glycerophosphoryl diester phosphodiesterase